MSHPSGSGLRWLALADRLVFWIEWPIRHSCRIVLGTLIFAAIAVNFANVFGRYVLGFSLGWAEEVMTYALIWAVFIGGIVVTLENEHLRTDFLSGLLRGVWRHVLEMLILVCLIGLCLHVARQSEVVMALMARTGQRSTVANIPMLWMHAAVMIGFTMMAAAGVLRFLRVTVEAARAHLGAPTPHEEKEPS